jgi:hypothetical protein
VKRIIAYLLTAAIALGATVNARNGVAITTASTINGKTPNSAINGQTIVSSLASGLVSYWRLDESSGNAADSVGSNTLTNTSVTYSTGKIGNGAVFVPASSANLQISSGSQVGLNITSDLSLSLWFKPNATPGSGQVLLSKSNFTTSNRTYQLSYENSGSPWLVWQISASGTNSVQTIMTYTTTLTNSTWYHLVVRYKASTTTSTIYIDGSLVATNTGMPSSIFNGTSAFTLGARSNTTADVFLDGMLDEVGIWSREITTTEIAYLYNSGSGQRP